MFLGKTFAGDASLAIGLIAAALTVAILGSSASCATEAPPSAWNPKPAEGDIIIPMPAGLNMVFRRIAIPEEGHWGRMERIFEVGAKGKPFETLQKVRIGGSFRDGRRWYNVLAKYEVSVAQFAAVTGQGDIARGLQIMAERVAPVSKADYVQLLRGDVDAAFNQKLSLPVTGLTIADYDAFIEAYNDWCIATPVCADAIQRNFQALGFFRLPTEVEWEYVARGGGDAAAAFERTGTPAEDRARKAFQDLLPVDRADLSKYAQVELRRGPAPIGSLQPLFGLHDLYGNVGELVAGPFAMDQFSSRIGGRVVRGGNYTTPASEIRASLREEVELFVKREDGVTRARPTTVGIRLALGSLVMDRRDLANIAREFTDDYLSANSTDIAGNTEDTARDVGIVNGTREIPLEDFIGGDDLVDYFKFRTTQYGRLRIEAVSIAGTVEMQVRSGTRTLTSSFAPGRNGVALFDKLVPGPVVVRFSVPSGSSVGRYRAGATLTIDDPAGATLAEAADLGRLADGQTAERKDYVGGDDLADVWKFQLAEPDTVEVQLDDLTENLDIDLRDSSDRVIGSSRQGGTTPEKIETPRLDRGTYYIRIVPAASDRGSIYTLRVAKGSIDTAGDTPATARDLGSLGPGEQRILEHVGGTDKGDIFKFTAQEQLRLQLTVGNMTSDVDLDLLNQSGQVIASSHKPGLERENIGAIVQPRSTYYIAVKPAGDSTAYSLDVVLSRIAPFSLPAVAAQATIGTTPSFLTHTLSPTNVHYFARFTLAASTRVSIDLEWPDQQTDLDLFLLNEDQTNIISSEKAGTRSESLSTVLSPGAYYVRVTRDSGPASPFTLSLRGGTSFASRDQAAGLSVGDTAAYTLRASERDYWGRFSLADRTRVSISLDWNDAAIDLDLILEDENGRQLDSSEGVTTVEKIDRVLQAGSYLMHVFRASGAREAPFRLSLTRLATPPPVRFVGYDNLDIEGGDFPGPPHLKGPEESACNQACQDRLGCIGYSYGKWNNACYLKQTLTGTHGRKDPGLRTVLRSDMRLPSMSPVAETMHDYTAREFRGNTLRLESRTGRALCSATCDRDTRCVGYSFTPPSSCELFDRIDAATSRPGAQGGLKFQDEP
jgi:hypothetical protein